MLDEPYTDFSVFDSWQYSMWVRAFPKTNKRLLGRGSESRAALARVFGGLVKIISSKNAFQMTVDSMLLTDVKFPENAKTILSIYEEMLKCFPWTKPMTEFQKLEDERRQTLAYGESDWERDYRVYGPKLIGLGYDEADVHRYFHERLLDEDTKHAIAAEIRDLSEIG